ncbi:MAG TPA: MraY family glycosyltransferase [Acidobacteriaceae bacterium]
MIYAPLSLGVTAFLLCSIATPLCRNLCLRLKIVDHPDGTRKLHCKPIPRVGGVPIVLSYAGAVALMAAVAPRAALIHIQHQALLWSMLPAVALVFATGLLDDLVGLRPSHKLVGQVVAAVFAVTFGARIHLLTGVPSSAWITLPLSVLWLLGCTNAFNLIDGLDGLASGVGLFATVTVLFAAMLQGNMGLAMATIPLAACLLAFLRYNFSPASIFLGDCGSMTIGFLLGCFGLIWSQKSATLLGMSAPVMAMAVPLIDVGLSIGRRFLSSRPIFEADRGHIHHRLLAKGLKPRNVALILYGVCGIAAMLSLLQSVVAYQFRGLTVVLFCALALYGVKRLGYVEFQLARRMLSRKSILRSLQEELYLHDLKLLLESAQTVEACWAVVSTACQDMQFDSVQMQLKGREFEANGTMCAATYSWQLTVSLGTTGYLRLARLRESDSPRLMMSVVHSLQETIRAKDLAA